MHKQRITDLPSGFLILALLMTGCASPPGFAGGRGTDLQPPLEAEQLILPDAHREFPQDMVWLVVQGASGPVEVPVPLEIPADWDGKVDVHADGNIVFYDYRVSPGVWSVLFSISALTESEWQAIQNEPHGEAIFSFGNIVWVYNPALENSHSGERAVEFSRMVGEAYTAVQSLPSFFTPQVSAESALSVLQAFFDGLAAGSYAEAVRLYGGSFDELAALNPAISPADHAALLAQACTVNGFACTVEIAEIVTSQRFSETAVQFTLKLRYPDGTILSRGDCCGADQSGAQTAELFVYTVAAQENRLVVLELPAYLP